MAASIWWWGECVLKPARLRRKFGLYRPDSLGDLPPAIPVKGGGPALCREHDGPVMLPDTQESEVGVEGFDALAPFYEQAVSPISRPIFDDLYTLMKPYLADDARILDPSCGPGTEARHLARLLPHGEVVAADLSQGMVELAWRQAVESGITNMAFFQADVADPPAAFEGYFDIVFCELAFHHYPDGEAAMRAFRRVLAPGGMVFIADPGPAWFNAMTRQFSTIADPGFNRHRTGEEFIRLCDDAGFQTSYWVESLPGFGITIASM